MTPLPSAEGVDTEESWPRLLERRLAQQFKGLNAEVLNFAITGYGPRQYSAVIKKFAPEFLPDLIVIGFFVNEYQDVLRTDDEFRDSIGLGKPLPSPLVSTLKRSHLRQLVLLRITQPVQSWIHQVPNPHGYFLGGFTSLESNPTWDRDLGVRLTSLHMQEISKVALDVEAEVLVVLIPAAIQVCPQENWITIRAKWISGQDPFRR